MPNMPAAAPALDDPPARLKGIALMLCALLCFALLDATAKWLSREIPTTQIVWSRYTFAALLAFIPVNPWRTPGFHRTRRPWLQFVRSLLLLMSTATNFIALHYLQLDQTMSIIFATPLMVAFLAGPMLGEWIGPRRLIAVLVGFLGVLVVTRPGLGGFHWAMALSLLGTVFYALYNIITRILASHDSTNTTLFWSSWPAALVMAPLAYHSWQTPSSLTVWLLMAATGASGVIGHFFLIAAHRLAPAAILAPFIYSQIIWMVLLGLLIFDQVPAPWTLAGAGIVIASGLYLLHRERRPG